LKHVRLRALSGILTILHCTSMSTRIGLYGGSFNPIHFGHLIVARVIREQINLAQVCFLPSRTPPHKDSKKLAEPDHRAEMVRLAIEGEDGFELDDFDLNRSGPCYTIDTIAHFRQRFPSAEICLLIGADSLMELATWHRAAELISNCTVVTAARTGRTPINPSELERAFGIEEAAKLLAGVVETPVIDISSTMIRDRVARELSIRYLVPESVREFIESNGLYWA
jgi:nicotinate-nucleotide adenylyltransferase